MDCSSILMTPNEITRDSLYTGAEWNGWPQLGSERTNLQTPPCRLTCDVSDSMVPKISFPPLLAQILNKQSLFAGERTRSSDNQRKDHKGCKPIQSSFITAHFNTCAGFRSSSSGDKVAVATVNHRSTLGN